MRNGSKKVAVENETSFHVMEVNENICHYHFRVKDSILQDLQGNGLEKLPYLRPFGPKKRPVKIRLTWICLRELPQGIDRRNKM